jgi:LysM repeat protein
MVDNCNKFYLVQKGDSCYDIAANSSVSLEESYSWNSGVEECKTLWPDNYVCVGIIGLTPTPSSTKATTTSKLTPTNGVTTPTPIQSPFITNCNKFYRVMKGDGCEAVATANSISFDQFYSWNPAVGQCEFLWPTYYVCVSIIGFTPAPSTTIVPTSTKSTPTNGIAIPTPVQSGLVGNCDSFYKVINNDGCEAIAFKYGITPSQFYTWNPYIESTCKYLWPDYYVCVSIVGVNPSFTTSIRPTKTQPGNGVPTPTPIQDGMTQSCKKFYKVVDKDGCWAIANTNNIDLKNFYAWNPAVKTDCTGLFPGYYVCVGV